VTGSGAVGAVLGLLVSTGNSSVSEIGPSVLAASAALRAATDFNTSDSLSAAPTS